ESECGRGGSLVPGHDGPSIPIRERHGVHTGGQAGDRMTYCAGVDVAAELSEHIEPLGSEDLRDAVGRAVFVVVEQAVVESVRVHARGTCWIGRGIAAEHGR